MPVEMDPSHCFGEYGRNPNSFGYDESPRLCLVDWFSEFGNIEAGE